MTLLEQQQQALLAALFDWPANKATKNIAALTQDTETRGLKAYQSNGHALAERALQAAYPVLAQMLGDESFADLARALWHAHPPLRGDLALWGEALPEFVQGSAQLADDPYLADVARAEWALHSCATHANRDAELSTLALLTTQEPADLQVALAPGCAVVRSQWPVASLLSAHREQTPSFAEVGQMLRERVAQDVLVWRQGLQPQARACLPGEADLLYILLQGGTLGQALEAAPLLDVGQWLTLAVQTSLLLAVSAKQQ